MNDLRLAFRALRASPIVTIIAATSLALGIGATTAIFSVVDGVLLRPLPVVAPHRLATVSSAFALERGFKGGLGWNYATWERMQQRAQVFDGAFAWTQVRFNLAPAGESQLVDGVFASGGFFDTLGVKALLGRTFTPSDDVRGGGPDGAVAVIGYRLWQRRFGGAGDVLGRPIVIDGVPFTIVGVTPPEFFGIEVGRAFDVMLPLGSEPLIRGTRSFLDQRNALLLTVMLRLKREQSLEQATAALRAMQPEILALSDQRAAPVFAREPYVLVPAATGTSDRSGLRRQYERPLLTLFAVVGLVLLVACVNIANLMLARATARRHELSVRLALGASRWRIARQFLVESLVLATLGSALGLLFALWSSRALVAQLSTTDAPVFVALPVDWRVLLFTAAVTFATALLFGTAPALRSTRTPPIDALKDEGRGGQPRATFSSALVVGQVALSLVLVFAAGLFVRTFEKLADARLGFDSDRVLVVDVDTARAQMDAVSRLAFYQRLVDGAGALPGVEHAAGSATTPLSAATKAPVFAEAMVLEHVITPGWFHTYGTAIRAGRDVDTRDRSDAAPVAVVNEAFVQKFLPGKHPVGELIVARSCQRPGISGCTVVGVVGDAVFGSVRGGMRPTIYIPLAQSQGVGPPGRSTVSISVRSAAGPPAQLAASVAGALTAVDRNLAFTFRPLADDVSVTLAQERLLATLAGFFGLLALLLAGLGLYGVTAYAVTRRRREIGVRLALGAAPGTVVHIILSRVALLVGAGLIAGAAASLWLSRLVAPLLYGLEPRDPVTLAGAVMTLVLAAALAGGLPAYRASRLDPAKVLREN